MVTCNSSEGANTVLSGFVITGGNATSGGGMSNLSSSSTVANCTFRGNIASVGGGMHNFESSPTVTNCTFSGNSAGGDGGGMYNSQSSPLVENCTFTGNTSDSRGGGIHNFNDSHPTVAGCLFSGNTGTHGGGMSNRTGCDPTVINCSFVKNNALTNNGGGMYNLTSCSPTLINCAFLDNSAGHVGGGIGIRENCHPKLYNCLFVGNSATDWGGAFRSGNTGSSPELVNCTFVGNSAQEGGAYSAGSDSAGPVGQSLLVNCIFRDNTAGLGSQIALNGNQPADVTVTYSNVHGGELDVYVEPGFTLTWGPGNIDADPRFADPGSGDHRLQSGSPAIDAGNNWGVSQDTADLDGDGDTRELTPWDLDGNPRFNADRADFDPGCGVPVVVDMGAYEFQFDPVDEVFLGDLDGDGIVGIVDFLALLADWGPCEPGCCLADLDIDGDVGITDFLLLLGNWTA